MKMSSKVNFLLVDDYPSVRTMVKTQLKKIGFKGPFHEANDVEEAIKILDKGADMDQPIEFVITDWLMPGKTGLDLVNHIRSSTSYGSVPILVLTTQNERATVIDTISAGATNYLLKPWSLDDMSEKLAKCWAVHQDQTND